MKRKSKLYHLLTSLPSSGEELLDSRILMLLCMLWCTGSKYDKALALTWLIEFSGGGERGEIWKDDPELDFVILVLL